jgi:crotonobetainyl-CoA:carnitine CoA-transferase CaiB-like acyl-CoA transferase
MPPDFAEFTDQSRALWTVREPGTASAATKKSPELNQPLANIRIIDLTQAWIGPYASQILSDLGAEVVKEESLRKPDVWRSLPPVIPAGLLNENARLVNTSSNFNSVNRDKKSLTLDLTHPRGRQLFLELVADADIVMENYTPNVMKRFQLSYDDLKVVNPSLIMTSFSGYGQTGPYSDYRANGTTIEATAGWDSLFGYRDGPPLVMGFYQTDAITGLQMAATTLAALNYRNRTGEGQYIQGSMFEAAVSYIDELILEASLGQDHERFGNRHPDLAPHGVYRCKGEDQWVAISVCSDEQFKRLKAQPGSGLTDPALLELRHRLVRQDFVDEQLERWTRQFSPLEITDLLQALGIPSAPVQRTDQILNDPHLEHRKWFRPLTHPDLGTHLYDGVPWHFSDSKLNSDSPSPRLGQHSRELLHDLLGLSQDEISVLFELGVSGQVS